MRKPNTAAAAHLAIGALAKIAADVPPGHHDLSRCEVVLTYPDFCAVSRAQGVNGDGTDPGAVSEPQLPPAAVLLFLARIQDLGSILLERAGLVGPSTLPIWADCIRAAGTGAKAAPPAEAVQALAQVQAALPPEEPAPRRTAAKRVGSDEVTVTVRRLSRSPKRLSAPRRKAAAKSA